MLIKLSKIFELNFPMLVFRNLSVLNFFVEITGFFLT